MTSPVFIKSAFKKWMIQVVQKFLFALTWDRQVSKRQENEESDMNSDDDNDENLSDVTDDEEEKWTAIQTLPTTLTPFMTRYV